MLEIIGYIGALIMGLVLGLTGSGGAILTVPILVYLFSVDAVLATTYSLGIVGFTGIAGTIKQVKSKNISWETAFTFGLASVAGVFVARRFILPLVPENLINFGDFHLSKGITLLLLFAVMMLVAAYTMIVKKHKEDEEKPAPNMISLTLKGLIIGLITGFVGASGGFLIIPVLVFSAGLPMKKAVGTSLFVVMVNCLIGFASSLSVTPYVDWKFMAVFVAIAMVGIILGIQYASKISNEKLKYGFGWFVLVMGVFIISKELILKFL
jgi:uncharacterized membrane protein YfcA